MKLDNRKYIRILNKKKSVKKESILIKELKDITEAGNKLAEAADYVQAHYEGVNRLRLALSNWYKVKDDENNRGNN